MEFSDFAYQVTELQLGFVAEWHEDSSPSLGPEDKLKSFVIELHRINFDLWHEEDKARAPDADDSVIAAVKKKIDKLNQARNDKIEKIDIRMQEMLQKINKLLRPLTTLTKDSPRIPWNTETPGSVIDRLSILALKMFHMNEQVERQDADEKHRKKCEEKAKTLAEQHKNLTKAFELLLSDLHKGKLQLKLYKQFKMYNDPSLNPAIYGAKDA